MKAEQARAYEAMKGQFEGLLGRLQVGGYPDCLVEPRVHPAMKEHSTI